MLCDGLVRRLTAALDERPDRELLARFAETRDEAAFTTIVHRHGPLVLGVCRRALRNEADADDAFQAVFLVLARKAGKVRWAVSVRGWLVAVAARVTREAKRRRAALLRRERAAARSPEGPQVTTDELPAVLDEELARLPEKYRAPLVLCYVDGKTRDEAAAELGWKLGAVKIRLERGRGLLRKRLEARGVSLPLALMLTAGTTVVPGAVASAAVRAATGDLTGVSVAGLALAQAVGATAFAWKIGAVVAAVVVLGVLGVAGAGGLGGGRTSSPVPTPTVTPVPVLAPARPAAGPPVAPGRKAVTAPDKNGLVIVLRPFVTRLAPGDPVRVVLRFEGAKGPIDSAHPLGRVRVLRSAMLDALTVGVTRPDGTTVALRPAPLPTPVPQVVEFWRATDLLLSFGEGGVEELAEQLLTTQPTRARLWAGNADGPGAAPGVYRVVVSGVLGFDGGRQPIPFASAPVSVERAGRGVVSLAEAETAARVAVEKALPGTKLPLPAAVVEDATGARVVRFRGHAPGKPNIPSAYTVAVAADGTPAGAPVVAPVDGVLVAGKRPEPTAGFEFRSRFDELFWPR